MIYLERNKANKIIVTASELRVTEGDLFYFKFKHEQSKRIYSVTFENVSEHTYRYDEFDLTLPDQINFKYEGDYLYWIYEDDTEEVLLEVGKMRLIPAQRDTQTNQVTKGNNSIHDDKKD